NGLPNGPLAQKPRLEPGFQPKLMDTHCQQTTGPGSARRGLANTCPEGEILNPPLSTESPATPPADAVQARRARAAASRRGKTGRVLWAGVEATLFRCSFHNMYGWRSFLLRCFGARIGRGCRIRRTVRTYYPWNLVMAEHCIVGDDAQLYDLGRIELGERSMI